MNSELLTLPDIAKQAGVSRRLVSDWASKARPASRRLKVLRLGHRTARVRPSDWQAFQERVLS